MSSPTAGKSRESSNDIDEGYTQASTLSTSTLLPSSLEPSEKSSSIVAGLSGRRIIPAMVPTGVTEIPIKSSISSVSSGRGSSTSRKVGNDDDSHTDNISTIKSLKLKLKELNGQLEEAERTEHFDGDTGIAVDSRGYSL